MNEPISSVSIYCGVKGFFKLDAIRLDDDGNEVSRRELAPWFPNLITNAGLNRAGTNADYLNWCQVGTGNTAPNVNDTALQSFSMGTQTLNGAVVNGSLAVSPYYAYSTRIFRFSAAVSNLNLTEVGVGWGSPGSLFSRALIVDALGNPITLTLLTGEILDVTYQLRNYPPLSDVTGNVTISAVNYSYTLRASDVTNNGPWSANAPTAFWTTFYLAVVGYDGNIGAITASPTGNTVAGFPTSNGSYTAGNYYKDETLTAGLSVGNLAGGIKSFKLTYNMGVFQVQFSPNIPKNNTNQLSLTFRLAWTRAP